MVKKWMLIIFVAMLAVIIVIPSMIGLLLKEEEGEEVVEWEGPEIRLLMHETGEIVTIPLEEYLVGVIAGEMPAAFELEALKAQAVAARTYTVKKMKAGINDKHPEADICDDPNHCQAWLSNEEMQQRWGLTGYTSYKRKIQKAVSETRGLILTHNGQLIEPVYHSTSGPQTENSEDVWQQAIPYLRSVPCEWDKESPRYQEQKTIAWDTLDRLLGTSLTAQPVSTLANSPNIIKITKSTQTGRAGTVRVGSTELQGTKFRSLLGLNSTNFDIAVSANGVTFTTTGYGHGVGMCQYGANGQAKEGRGFADILTYYYTDVKVMKMQGY
ncbi:MAG: stage II sporulation protein D [Bacillota bacterium]|nr:stage II sporulation protein D [Bacillota bacterium]